METFNHKLNTYVESWMGPRDQRVRGWLLLDNYPPTFALTVMYLLIVWLGPKYMKNRQPYSCRGLLVLYNLGLTLLSFYMFYELMAAAWYGGYNFYCQDIYNSQEVDTKVPDHLTEGRGSSVYSRARPPLPPGLLTHQIYNIQIAHVLWWYYFSKLIEFMDTFFFILRKNNHQITILHIYHHASMLNIWWFVMNYVPCGHSYFGAALNSFIHVVMYSYYGLSAIPAVRPYLWWKKYITQLQLSQFFLTMSQTMCAVIWPCGFPMGWLYFQIGYIITLIFFFANFYIQTYKKHSVSQKKEHQNGSSLPTNGHANGTGSSEHTAYKKLRMD